MNLSQHLNNNLLKLKVIPHAKESKLAEENNSLKLHLKSPPENNKANLELIKFFKKEYGLRVQITKGMKSREKILRIVR